MRLRGVMDGFSMLLEVAAYVVPRSFDTEVEYRYEMRYSNRYPWRRLSLRIVLAMGDTFPMLRLVSTRFQNDLKGLWPAEGLQHAAMFLAHRLDAEASRRWVDPVGRRVIPTRSAV